MGMAARSAPGWAATALRLSLDRPLTARRALVVAAIRGLFRNEDLAVRSTRQRLA